MNGPLSILRQDLIGLNAKVVRSSNADCVNVDGRVIDETRNTIKILHETKAKMIVKQTAVFQFTAENGTILEVDGKVLIGRPEDRIKKRVKRRW
jgi:ribonuclease P protein subunit POP4